MSKDKIISLVEGFTIELNPKVRFKLNSIPLDPKNHIYITYLPDASENDILETVEFVSNQKLTPIPQLPARTMIDLEHVKNFLSEIRKRTDGSKILVIGGGGDQKGKIQSSLDILESGLLNEFGFHHNGIAGHPEGSPDINQETIDQFLNKKFELSKLKNLNFEINDGDFIGIFGNSGSGKTTLIDLLTGFLKATDGGIYVLNNDIQKNIAIKSKENHQAGFQNNIVTEISHADIFYKAEEYHQKYILKGNSCAI